MCPLRLAPLSSVKLPPLEADQAGAGAVEVACRRSCIAPAQAQRPRAGLHRAVVVERDADRGRAGAGALDEGAGVALCTRLRRRCWMIPDELSPLALKVPAFSIFDVSSHQMCADSPLQVALAPESIWSVRPLGRETSLVEVSIESVAAFGDRGLAGAVLFAAAPGEGARDRERAGAAERAAGLGDGPPGDVRSR